MDLGNAAFAGNIHSTVIGTDGNVTGGRFRKEVVDDGDNAMEVSDNAGDVGVFNDVTGAKDMVVEKNDIEIDVNGDDTGDYDSDTSEVLAEKWGDFEYDSDGNDDEVDEGDGSDVTADVVEDDALDFEVLDECFGEVRDRLEEESVLAEIGKLKEEIDDEGHMRAFTLMCLDGDSSEDEDAEIKVVFRGVSASDGGLITDDPPRRVVIEREDEDDEINTERAIPDRIGATESFRFRDVSTENHLEMPERSDDETLQGYLGRLGLEIMREKKIDSNGSCAYDSIFCLLKRLGHYKSLHRIILAMMDLSDPFPLRILCQRILRMRVQGTAWEHIYTAHKALEGSDDEGNVNKNTTVRWIELADGKRWADHSVLQLLAICLDINIVVIQERDDKIMKVSTMLSVDDGNMKEPILLLLRKCHYLPLVDFSEEGWWYKKLSGMTSIPWVLTRKCLKVSMTPTVPAGKKVEVVSVSEKVPKVVIPEPVSDCEELVEQKKGVSGERKEKRRYTCDSCGRVYCYREGLARHKRDGHGGIYGGVRRYSCNHCGKTFSNNTHLNQHVTWAHVRKGEKRYRCQKCDYGAAKAGYLSLHYKKEHETDK